MPREYQLKTTGYALPHNIYMQVKYVIKDYHHMLRERDKIMRSSPSRDGQPKATGPSDSTASKAIRLAMLSDRVNAIDTAMHDVGATYMGRVRRGDVEYFDCMDAFEDYGYFCYALYNPAQDNEPSVRTWKRYKAVFAYEIAKNLKLI